MGCEIQPDVLRHQTILRLQLDPSKAVSLLISVVFNSYSSNERIHYQGSIFLVMHWEKGG